MGVKETDDEAKQGALGRMVSSYTVPKGQSDQVINKLTSAPDTDLGNLRQLKANVVDASRSKNAEDLYKNTRGGALTEVLRQMKELTTAFKDRDEAKLTRLASGSDATSTVALTKRMFAKVALAGFKVSLAGAKVGAGAGAETAVIVGIPLDTLVDAISLSIDVALFASTTLTSIFNIISSFNEVKTAMISMMRFEGGPSGVAAAVDSAFDQLERLGLRGRAQKMIGSLIGLFDRFIRWGAPLIGSLIGLAIPYDAAVVGRVLEFFLYPIKLFITRGWPLIQQAWDLVPGQWQQVLTDRDRWMQVCVGGLELIKRLFPTGDQRDWKDTVIERAQKIGVTALRFHPLVIIGVVSRERLDRTAERLGDAARTVGDVVDAQVNAFIDKVVAPNLDKIITVSQAALGVGFGLLYTLYRYSPDGTRKALGLPAAVPSAGVAAVAAHLCSDSAAATRFISDTEQRQHEIRTVMCRYPTLEGLAFLSICMQLGVPIDPGADYMASPAVAARNFQLHRGLMFPC